MNLYSMIASKELRLCDDARQRASIHTDKHKQPAAVLRDQGKYSQAGEMYRQAIGPKPTWQRTVELPGR